MSGMMKNPVNVVNIYMLSFIYFRTLIFTAMYVAFIYDHNDRVYSGHVFGNSFESIEKQLKEGFYKQTTFQLKPDTIRVYELVVESNGYTHTGKLMKEYKSTEILTKK